MKIKKWNGSSWVQEYPEVNVSSIVATGTPSSSTFLRGDGTWATPADSTTLGSLGITATAAEINKLDGVTATTTELNYVDGVTSNIQTQLNGKATLNASSNTFAGEVFANKFIIGNDSDGANEIPNWAFSEYNNKPCVSSEYLSDTYYPIYHEGNKPAVADVTGAQSLQTRYYYDTYGTDSLITNGANSTTSWTKTTGTTTPSSLTGPQSPYTNISGFYYTEASGVNNVLHTMILSVPTISNAAFMSFGFWWHMYGANMGTLTISYTTNGSTYVDVWTKTGNQGNVEWQQAEVAIPRTALSIRINGTTGSAYDSDMCIANMHIDMRV